MEIFRKINKVSKIWATKQGYPFFPKIPVEPKITVPLIAAEIFRNSKF